MLQVTLLSLNRIKMRMQFFFSFMYSLFSNQLVQHSNNIVHTVLCFPVNVDLHKVSFPRTEIYISKSHS